MQAGFAFSKLAERLSSLTDLTAQDLDLLADMPSTLVHVGAHQSVARHHGQADHCSLLLQGYLSWYVPARQDGQITSIYVPGDIPDLYSLYQSSAGASLVALGSAVVALVPHDFFRELSTNSPAMSRALLLMMLADLAIQRNWTVNLGSRDALTRVAHLLCEVTERLHGVGLARDFSFPSPFTQSDLAAACGISPVHANRTIQELRRRALLQWQGKTMTITDWPGLVRLAGFDPAYLRTRAPGSRTRSPQPEPVPMGVELA